MTFSSMFMLILSGTQSKAWKQSTGFQQCLKVLEFRLQGQGVTRK